MLSKLLLSLTSFLVVLSLSAQEKWDIRKCVDFALKNNISVKQADLQARFSELTLKQNKAGQLPTLNFNTSMGYRLGRSENPTTGVFEDNNLLNLGMQAQSQVTLFNWFSIKRGIESSKLSWEADIAQSEKVRNDVSLNVAIAYLQILLSREQARLAEVQVSQTMELLGITRKKVDAGALPELNAAELEAQIARDSSLLVTARGTVQQFILQMKALLNLDAGAPFDVVEPPVNNIPLVPLAELEPESVYNLALKNLPQQKANDLRLQSAEKAVLAYRGNMYPSLSAFGSLFTNAIHFRRPIYSQDLIGYSADAGIRTNIGGTYYPVEVPVIVSGTDVIGYFKPGPWGKQLSNNFGQNFGIAINVPLFNGRQARTAWDRSKLQVRQMQLTVEQDNMTLKQDIYNAHNDAMVAMQKYNANKKAVETSEKAFSYAQKRYELALLSTYDLVTTQNNLQRARIDLLYAQYDYVFKIKLLEFYRGQGISL